MTEKELVELVNKIDAQNLKYILADYDIRSEFECINRWQGTNKDSSFLLERLKNKIEVFDSRHLTPANVIIGDGATVVLYSDRHAGTIIKVTKTTITIQRDKATLSQDFKPEWIIGGFAGHCTNQNEQSYIYECDENGAKTVLYWSEKYNRYGQPGEITAVKGRNEFYDYNF